MDPALIAHEGRSSTHGRARPKALRSCRHPYRRIMPQNYLPNALTATLRVPCWTTPAEKNPGVRAQSGHYTAPPSAASRPKRRIVARDILDRA